MTEIKPKSPYRLAIDSIIRNFLTILSGRIFFGLVNLAAYALATRAVSLDEMGVVMTLQAYVRLLGGVLSFQAWKAVLTYGQPLLEKKDDKGFRRLIGLMLRLEALAIMFALGVAILFLPMIGDLLGWSQDVRDLAPYYTLLLIVEAPTTSVGLVRIFDRVTVLRAQHGINACVRLVGSAAVYVFGGGVQELVIAWGAALFISCAWTIQKAIRIAIKRKLAPSFKDRVSAAGRTYKGIWRFVVVTNISSILENLLVHATILVVGGVLGQAEAALFGLVRQVTESLNKVGSILGPIIFPEIAVLEARGQRSSLVKLLRRVFFASLGFLTVVLGVLFLLGDYLLYVLYEIEAPEAYTLLLLSGAAAGFIAIGFSFEPTLLTANRPVSALWTAVAAMTTFGVILTLLIGPLGIVGVGIALLARAALITGLRGFLIYRMLRS